MPETETTSVLGSVSLVAGLNGRRGSRSRTGEVATVPYPPIDISGLKLRLVGVYKSSGLPSLVLGASATLITVTETFNQLPPHLQAINMKFLQGLGVFASVASAVSVDLSKRDSPLDVKIQMVDNSIVEATITNTGTETLRLFKTGTILDTAAVEKTEVFSGCTAHFP